ncbi:FG-GAP-like repeat-containing protein, partial [Microcoleus sp. Pol8_D6]
MKTLPQINRSLNNNIGSLVGCTSNKPTEIVILDPTIPDSQHLISGIKPDTATYILKSQPDAVEQITAILAQHRGIETLHIITHGDSGNLYLGTTELNSSNIQNYSHQLQQWRNAFTDNANIILYGCSVAAGDRGHQFLTQLHQLTGANISANSQPTGNCKLGGTWDILQLIPPSSEAPQLALTETTLKTYSGVLGLSPQVTFTTGTTPFSVSIGDFNLDGKPDLAVANFSNDTASILLNTAATNATTPTFATKVDFTTGTQPVSVSIGDFNLDGKPDLAVVNFITNAASILLNTTATGATTPTFATRVDLPTGNRPFSVSIGDFNLDGKPDLAVTNTLPGVNTVSILLNTTATGATTPTFATRVDLPTGNRPYSVSIGDINGDGKPDLAIANYSGNNASILLNTTPTGAATPTFATQVTFPTGINPRFVSIGDFNLDGKPDLAVANRSSNTASILLNTTPTGATTPTFANQVQFTTGTQPFSVSIGDINGDGKPDLAVGNVNSNSASILLNTTATGAATPTFATKIDFPTGLTPRSVSIGDINGDGKPDLAVANTGSNTASILLNYTPTVSIAAGTTPTETGPTTGTFNITLDTAAPAGGIVVNFNTTGSTAATPGHYSLTAGTNITAVTANTFTIAAGVTTAVLNAVPIDDAIVNPGETVQVNVTADPNNFNYFVDPVAANTTGTLTITDNDFPTVNLSVSPVTSTETGTPVITVTATASSAVVGAQTVNVALSGTATAADFTGTIPDIITIPDGQTTGSFTVNVIDDALVEGSETGTFTISTPSSGVTLGSTTTGNVDITDNDFPTVNLSVSPVTSTETGTPV